MKNVLGLDLGTNSIGWALVDKENQKILGMGSRIIPMSQDILGEFGKGNSVSQTAERTSYRSMRRLRQRHLLRRERLHRVLNILGFLPEHYSSQIDFETRLGKVKEDYEPKLAYKPFNNGSNDKKHFDFIFKNSFNEMLADFKQSQPILLKDGRKIPYDWTIYYLRKKALKNKIEKEELAWIILNFNQKRGYYQLRDEEEDTKEKREYVGAFKVVKIEKGDKDKKNDKKNWYNITLENDWIYSATFTAEPQWLNKVKEFLVTEELDENGFIKIVKDRKNDKAGKEKRKITPLPSFDEINLMSKSEQDKIYKKIKAKTEAAINNSGKTVGEYIYESLLKSPSQKIRGKLIRTIERKYYKEELKQILQKQIEFHPELRSENLYCDCVRELYRNNEAHQILLSKRDIVHLFIEDIIFYQRPLRSQKSSIGNCAFEFKKFTVEGEEKTIHLKAISKSHPLYQEFRLWQWIYNIRIIKKDDDTDVTDKYLNSDECYADLFEFLNDRKEIEQKSLLKYFKLKESTHRWNYVEDKKYPCNETRSMILNRLSKVKNISEKFLTQAVEEKIWHIIYSVIDKNQYEHGIKTFAKNHNLDVDSFYENFIKFPPFKSEYGSFSAKAIKKLLPLMRIGKFWNDSQITKEVKDRANSIFERLNAINFDIDEIENVADDEIPKQILKSFINKKDFTKGLQLYQASYLIYGRHSEASESHKWYSVSDLDDYLNEFKQHSLRNPIVEQVITETLRVVKDIWLHFGKGEADFFDEIHIELGREMKNTADERKRISDQVIQNENTNLRIKALLAELKNDSSIENVRPYSPIQQELLKIYEDGILNSDIEIPEDILKISKTAQPSSSDLQKYKLWLEQKYRSPYTGQVIPLNKLFTSDYEIEHIIPQSRYFDDSFNNKVICESAVNKLKDNQIGLEFIKNHHGENIETGFGKRVKIFEVNEYEDFVKSHYSKNRSKRNKLLMDDIPERMIERQVNDTRYISSFISSILSNIVRAERDDNGVNSKNLIAGNGKITTILKQDWGLNDVWNDLVLPRFQRLNQLTNTESFTKYSEKYQKFLPAVPLEFSKYFQIKRIDHRHHALDALVIACATRDHVNLLNNKYAKSKERFDLNRKLRLYEKIIYNHPKTGERIERDIPREFLKPWDNFTADAKSFLETIVISFKQNLRIINKTNNHYEKWVEVNGVKTKKLVKQTKGDNWAIRKPLHKETVSGKVDLKHIKVPKGKILTATRKTLDTSFDYKTIESITDLAIQKILINYLKTKEKNPELAFSPEGIEYLNKNITLFNNGKNHQPIYKVRVFEVGSKFPLGESNNKKTKYVEAAKGTNLFFAIYINEEGKRYYETIPLNVVIERQKQGLNSVPEMDERGNRLLFHLSPNDLVYVPTVDEAINKSPIDFNNLTNGQKKRLYNVNDFSSTCYFTPNRIAKAIAPKEVDLNYDKHKNKLSGSYDTKTASYDGIQIKDVCIKLKVDRLGNIKSITSR